MPAGNVYVFNPTSSDYNLQVNGQTQNPLPGTNGSLKWVAGTTKNPLPRTDDGNPADSKFGWANHVVLQPTAGGSQAAQFDLNIPHSIQNSNDIQLYVYYSGDFQTATYTALNQGAIFARGGLTAAL